MSVVGVEQTWLAIAATSEFDRSGPWAVPEGYEISGGCPMSALALFRRYPLGDTYLAGAGFLDFLRPLL